MASRGKLLILSTLVLLELCHTNNIPTDVDYFYNDDVNMPLSIKDKRAWFSNFQHNLGKHKNFYANLLQEENQDYAVELQELYNIVSMALVESDIRKREKMLTYSKWLLESTKDLEAFLIAKGMQSI